MNHANSWIQLTLYVGALLLITKPLGLYLLQVLDAKGRTWLDPVLRPVERAVYGLCGIEPESEQGWLGYTCSMLAFSAVGLLFTYVILRLQGRLPLNPQHLPSLSPHLAFTTAASFTTNTNWQFYTGETTMSYLSQMVALTFHNWASAATGIAIAAALVRGLARHSAKTLGSFWVDLVRVSLYLLMPICLVFSVFLIWQGTPENFHAYTVAKTLEAHADQTIVQGPIASQISIKMLGTNGGGFTNANSAHPFEDSTPLSNFIQMLSIFAIPSALTFYLGRMLKQPRHGWAVWTAMFVMFLGGVLACWRAESLGNPIHQHEGVAAADGNMEGKEVRFGIFNSALFATITTDASCGAVNCMHDSLTPIGGLVPMFNLQTGEVIFGGVGAGLYGMLIYVILAVFIAGLMVGRTPEYAGKKIESYDVKMAMLTLMILAATILGFTALTSVCKWGTNALGNAGPHGFSELLYAFSSCVGNNGSAFAGLSGNEPHWDTYTGLAMLIGRFLMIVPIMALAGSLAAKKFIPPSAGTFRTEGFTFVVLLVGTVLLVGALTFLPGLAMGPVVEHYLMRSGTLF